MAIFGGGADIAYYFEVDAWALFCGFVFAVMVFALLCFEEMTPTRDDLTVRSGIGFLKLIRRIPLSELEELCLSNPTRVRWISLNS